MQLIQCRLASPQPAASVANVYVNVAYVYVHTSDAQMSHGATRRAMRPTHHIDAPCVAAARQTMIVQARADVCVCECVRMCVCACLCVQEQGCVRVCMCAYVRVHVRVSMHEQVGV